MKKHKAILAIFICICLLTPPCLQLSTIGKVHAEMDYALGEVLSSPDTNVSANVMDNAECGELYEQLMSSTTPAEAQALLSSLCDAYPESYRDILLANENVALGGHENLFIHDEQQGNGTEDVDDTPDFIGVAPLVDTPSGNSGSGEGNQISASGNDAVSLIKYATANDDGSYTITLEAWVNGMVAATALDPMDIVLVLTHSSENGCELRNSELRNTLRDFCDRIKEQSADGTKNRIAIVGHDAGITRYESAFQNMATRKGQRQISEIISELNLSEAVQLNVGLEMAEEVLEANPINNGEDRKRVVIVLSDGVPCVNTDWDAQSTEDANSAITIAKKIKQSGATVYSVGIFEGANGSTENLPKFDSNGENNATQVANRLMHLLSSNYPNAKSMASKGKLNANACDGRSYYLSAADANAFNGIFEGISNAVIGAANLGSYACIKDIVSVYFTLPEVSAIRVYTADANANTDVVENTGWDEPISLTEIYVGIDNRAILVSGFNYTANKVTSPNPHSGTTDVYGKKLIVQYDLVPQPGFMGGNNVPVNDLGSGIYPSAAPNEYAVDYFTETLVNVAIPEFTVNAVEKNVYLLGNLSYNQLKADATAIADDVHNGSVDLLNIAQGEEWKVAYVSITISIYHSEYDSLKNDTTYTLTVNVEPNASPSNSDICNVGDIAVAQTDSDEKAINVYKPVLKFGDKSGYYGQCTPVPVESSCTHISWEHGTISFPGSFTGGTINQSMIGDEPCVSVEYKLAGIQPIVTGENDKTYLVVTQTFEINARPKIGNIYIDQYTDFDYEEHDNCDRPKINRHVATAPSPEAYYHVNTCSITITKVLELWEGVNEDSIDPEQNFIFNVKYVDDDINNDGISDSGLFPVSYEVAIIGEDSRTIVDIPMGTYIVTEDEDWSWQYNRPVEDESGDLVIVPPVYEYKPAPNDQGAITLPFIEDNKPDINNGTVTVTNTLTKTNLFSDEAVAVNVFDSNATGEVYTPVVPMILPKKEGDRW